MKRCIRSIYFLVFFAFGCGLAQAQDSEDFVAFKLSEISKKTLGDTQQFVWLATHDSVKGRAQFLISMEIKRPTGNALFTFSRGSIEHVQGSQPTEFLRQLAAALGAEKPKVLKQSASRLPFSVAILGTNQSHDLGGSFSDNPPGSWIVTKIFLANDQAEVYLNLDPRGGIGEFSIKDEEYGNAIIQELSKVL
jgi:hypothetical protein